MILKILMLTMAAAGLAVTFTTKRTFTKLIAATMAIGVGITLMPGLEAQTTGIFTFVAATLATAVFILQESSISNTDKSLFMLAILPVAAANLFITMHWPFAGILSLVSIASLIAAIYLLITKFKQHKEVMGPLVVIGSSAAITSGIVLTSMLLK